MKKECTEEEARLKAEAYCAMSEHCSDDVFRKLEQWGAPLAAYDSILGYLRKEKFVDDQRYAIAFVRDKYRFSQWGRIKIAQLGCDMLKEGGSLYFEINRAYGEETILMLKELGYAQIELKKDSWGNDRMIKAKR